MKEESFGDMTLIETRALTRLHASRYLLGVIASISFVAMLLFGGTMMNYRQQLNIFRACHTWALEGYVIANPPDCLTFVPGNLHRSLAPKQNPSK